MRWLLPVFIPHSLANSNYSSLVLEKLHWTLVQSAWMNKEVIKFNEFFAGCFESGNFIGSSCEYWHAAYLCKQSYPSILYIGCHGCDFSYDCPKPTHTKSPACIWDININGNPVLYMHVQQSFEPTSSELFSLDHLDCLGLSCTKLHAL